MLKNKIFLDINNTEKALIKRFNLQVMLFVHQENFFLSAFPPKGHDF